MTIQAVATRSRLSVSTDRLRSGTLVRALERDFPQPIMESGEALGWSQPTSNISDRLILWLETDEWGQRENLADLRRIILNLCSVAKAVKFPLRPEIEWPIITRILENTETEVSPAFNELDEETVSFIERLSLREGVSWLQVAIPVFFSGADFEIELFSTEEDEEILAVRVYGSLSASAFRERRHALYKAMKDAGHGELYEVVSVFQRRTRGDGWQAISLYSALSAE
ncbi:MAG: hypothetical protein JRI58_08650 [Deltaproteobacteria bacterium]|nr:hypothetical protein [Deltaproteobacteria bacterium]MBW2074801.1 hypothetical protein [Deltaproteobacteria bacterium]